MNQGSRIDKIGDDGSVLIQQGHTEVAEVVFLEISRAEKFQQLRLRPLLSVGENIVEIFGQIACEPLQILPLNQAPRFIFAGDQSFRR